MALPFATELRINLDRAQVLVSTASGRRAGTRRGHRSYCAQRRGRWSDPRRPAARGLAPRHPPRAEAAPGHARSASGTGCWSRRSTRPRISLAWSGCVLAQSSPIVALIIAGYLLIGQLGSVDLVTVFREAHWGWVPLIVLFSAADLRRCRPRIDRLCPGAVAFPADGARSGCRCVRGLRHPPAVGGWPSICATCRRRVCPRRQRRRASGRVRLVNAVSHIGLLLLVAALTGANAQHGVAVPGWLFIALGALAFVFLILLAIPITRRWVVAWVLPPVRRSDSAAARPGDQPAQARRRPRRHPAAERGVHRRAVVR